MTDAHLPNNHPGVTPGWIEPKKPLTSFSKALETRLTLGTNNVFEAMLYRDWCSPGPTGWAATGGFCNALMISTSKKYMAFKHEEKKQPDLIHLHVQYINPLPAGAIKITITPLQLGSRHSILQVSLSSSTSKPSITALVTQGNLSISSPRTTVLTDKISIPLEQVPNRETECVRWTEAQFYHMEPISVRYRTYTVKGGPTPMWSPKTGLNMRDKWLKIDDENGGRMSLEHVGVVADLIAPIPLHYEKDGLAGMARWVFPTMCLSIDIKRDPEGEEWLLQRTSMTHCENGRFEMDVKIIDVEGRLVATSKHSCLIFPRTGTEPKRNSGGERSVL